MLIAITEKENKYFVCKIFAKKYYKKKLIVLSKSIKKSKFLAILEIYLQLSTKFFYKNLINSNNKNIIKLANNRIFNNFTKISIFFENIKYKLFINKKISIKI